MKKYVVVLAALLLSGCAYSQFQASYLDEYENHDCQDLAKERIYAKAEMGRIREKTQYSRDTISGHSGSASGPLANPTTSYFPGYQEARMRNHARKQAIGQLQNSQGCRNNKAATNS